VFGIPDVALFGAAAIVAMAAAAIGSAHAQGKAATRAMDAIWRQPEAAGRVQTSMMLGLAFMEALTLFVLVSVFLLAGVAPRAGLFAAVAVLAMAFAAVSSAWAQGNTAVSAMDAVWRQPEAGGRVQTSMMLGLAFMEALTLFVLVSVFLLSGVAERAGLFAAMAVLAMGVAAFGSARAQGRTAVTALDAVWRQPEAGGRLQTSMMLGLAFMEALTLFVLVSVFLLSGTAERAGLFAAVAVLAMAAAAFGSAAAQGKTAMTAMDAIWRQPEAGGRVQTSMMLGLAFMEALTLFVLVAVFLLSGAVAG